MALPSRILTVVHMHPILQKSLGHERVEVHQGLLVLMRPMTVQSGLCWLHWEPTPSLWAIGPEAQLSRRDRLLLELLVELFDFGQQLRGGDLAAHLGISRSHNIMGQLLELGVTKHREIVVH